jgi:CDP-diacylglycerol--glycerol-3-phosphate 3-phosphatidyltransferase
MQLLTDSDIVPNDPTAQRLRGTVWQDVQLAHVGYSMIHAVGRGLGRARISANTLTLMALALSAAAGVAVASGHLWGAAALVLVSGLFDALDGVVARSTGTTSRWGALLDSTVDRFADAFPLLGVAALYLAHDRLALIPVGTLVLGFGVSYVRARAEALGIQLPALFMRRAERTILLILCLALGAVELSPVVPHALLLAGVGILGVMNAIGVIAALRAARKALNAEDARVG